jgi:5-methylthioribose kinase
LGFFLVENSAIGIYFSGKFEKTKPMTELSEGISFHELEKLPYWKPGEKVLEVESAGESNMNLVLRIITSERSLIFKQSKPYVRKYPQIPAPIERIEVEHEFLKLLNENQLLATMTPSVIHFDKENHLLITGDLGKGTDFSSLYRGTRTLDKVEVIELVNFLNTLHGLEVQEFPSNQGMRFLNHEHLFRFPFLEGNGFNLDSVQEGLQKLSLPFKTDTRLKLKLDDLGNRYLSEGKTLIHGDFYPGSWLKVNSGIKVIDPEFGFLGDAEFDLGVFLSHLDLTAQTEEYENLIFEKYQHPVDERLVNQFRGMEILRRLIGIAQLPLASTLAQKAELLERARNFILS